MDFHVSTPVETELVMETENGRVVEVWPAPPSSLPAAAPVPPAPGK
jgi:hypothetical protein